MTCSRASNDSVTRQRDLSTLTEGKSFLCLCHDDDDDDDEENDHHFYDDDDDVRWEKVFSRDLGKEITD